MSGWAHALCGDAAASAAACAVAAELSGFGDAVIDGMERFAAGMAALVRGDAAGAIGALERGQFLLRDAPGLPALFGGALAEATPAAGEVAAARHLAEDAIAQAAAPPMRWHAGWAKQARGPHRAGRRRPAPCRGPGHRRPGTAGRHR